MLPSDQSPDACGPLLEGLLGLLDDRGVELQVAGGRLQLRDPGDTLSAADRDLVRQHRSELLVYLTAGACPGCGVLLTDDATAYRTDDRNRLLERCVSCGHTWRWGDQ